MVEKAFFANLAKNKNFKNVLTYMEKFISEEGRGGVIFLVKYTLGFLFSTLASSWLSERLDVRGALSDPS